MAKNSIRIFIFLFLSNLCQAQVFIPFSYWKSMFANLTISDGPSYNYGLLPTSSDVDKTFTLTNTGSDTINNMSGSAFSSTSFTFKGGSYPGTNGTCGIFLTSSSSCTVVVTANSSTAATYNSHLIINYTDSQGGPYIARRPVSAQFTATTITSLFIAPSSGNFKAGDTQQLKCYGNTSDGGTIDLTTTCSWSSSNTGRVTVNNTTNKGLITGIANGSAATITATYASLSATASISVNNSTPTFNDPGVGLSARYYSTTGGGAAPNDPYSVLQNQRIDSNVNFNWAAGSNPAGGLNNFAAIWTGQITAPTSGAYCIQTVSDDGVRLWINNTLVINNYTDHSATTNNGTFTFVANQKYDIIYEFYENGGDAVARLLYVAGSCGTGTAVSQANLYSSISRALDMDSNSTPRYTELYRGFNMNGTVGNIANGATITGMTGGGSPTPINATASNANGTGMAYVNTERSQGVNFDGIDDYISVAASTLPTGSAARTLSAWVNPNNTGTNQPVTYYGNNSATNAYGFEVLPSGAIRHSINGTQCDSTSTIPFGDYSLVTVTLTGTTGRIYINGALDSSCTFGSTPNTSTGSTLYIGRDIAGANYFSGVLDDVGYWARVLTVGEINTLYIRGKVYNP